jgi:predicted nucleotidyltransferase
MVIKVNDIDLRTLALFTKSYDSKHYIREVEKLLKVSSRTALVTLAKLEKIGILESRKRGKIKVYSIRKTALSREFFLLAEQYKKILFLEKNQIIKEVLEKADTFMQGIVIIFGSYAKGIQKEDSDLDLFIVGAYDKKKIKNTGKKYGIDINIKSYPLQLFEKEIHNDILLKEIKKDHILIKDAEGFVRKVIKWIR